MIIRFTPPQWLITFTSKFSTVTKISIFISTSLTMAIWAQKSQVIYPIIGMVAINMIAFQFKRLIIPFPYAADFAIVSSH